MSDITTSDDGATVSPDAGYQHWWREPEHGVGLVNVYALTRRRRVAIPPHTLESYRHPIYGDVLVVDGELCAAQRVLARPQMLAHVPLLGRDRRDAPAQVTVVGDYGALLLRELLRHPADTVTAVTLITPHRALTEAAAGFCGNAAALADPRVRIVVAGGDTGDKDDDRDDDIGDGETGRTADRDGDTRRPGCRLLLLGAGAPDDEALYRRLADTLSDDAAAVVAASVLPVADGGALRLPGRGAGAALARLAASRPALFRAVDCYQTADPLATGGYSGFFLYRRDGHRYHAPAREAAFEHYDAALHRAAFVLPGWWRGALPALCAAGADPPAPTTGTGPRAGAADTTLWFEQTRHSGISQALTMTPLARSRSAYQTIEFFEHPVFGRLLALDGTVQCSRADECVYHEMAVQVPLLGRRRERPAEALIVGGGDGGILRELLCHDPSRVGAVTMVEIDREVVDGCNRHLGIAGDYADPRVTLQIGDAADFIAEAAAAGRRFDLIVVDATDSTAPADRLWNDAFFRHLAGCLSDDGVCLDSDILIHGNDTLLSRDSPGDGLRDVQRAAALFASVQCYQARVPLFPGGYFALFLYTKDGHDYAEPQYDHRGRHYHPALHRAAFALPGWWRQRLEAVAASPAPAPPGK